MEVVFAQCLRYMNWFDAAEAGQVAMARRL
jgi:hypothetical protein